MKKDGIKSWIIFLSAFFHVALIYTFPPDGGGVSLFFTLTVPFIFVFSIILSLIYYFKFSKLSNQLLKNLLFLGSVLLLISIGYQFFPCTEDKKMEIPNRPCPCSQIGKTFEILTHKKDVNYNDIFKDGYYSTLVKTGALKKFKNNLPDKYYTISFSNSDEEFVIYFKNGEVFSTNKDLKVLQKNNKLIYIEVFKKDTIKLSRIKSDFKVDDENYFSRNRDDNFESKNKYQTIYINKGSLKRNRTYLIYDLLYKLM